jgi:transcriptional regulator with XRE-family HTH domain
MTRTTVPAVDELERALGRQFRILRIQQDLSQAELADRANVSIGALRHLESGHGVTTTTLVKVVRALDRQAWLEDLAPSPTFSPIALLEQRREVERAAANPRRVRRQRTT